MKEKIVILYREFVLLLIIICTQSYKQRTLVFKLVYVQQTSPKTILISYTINKNEICLSCSFTL